MEFKKTKLANGLTIIHEKRDVPVTTVMLAVRYGSAYESIEEKGIAHFIEHMCFKGTEKRTAKEIAETLEKVGGDLNAFTSEETTAYHVKLPSEHLQLAIDVISDIFFNASFPEEDIKKESNVICEEIKMYCDNPKMHVLNEIKSCLYNPPFGMFGAGTEESVRSLNREVLFKRHKNIYVPENSFLCVVGNNEFEEIVQLAEKFTPKTKGEKIEIKRIQKQYLKKEEKRKELNQTNLALGFHFPTLNEKERYAAEVFSAILGEGMSSKLFTEVREKRGLVYGVKSEIDNGKDYSYFVISAGTDSSKKDEVIKICLEEFKKMGEITEQELEQAKIQVIGNRNVEQEGSGETALNLVLEEIGGDAQKYYSFEEEIKKVVLDDIKKLSAKTEYASFVLTR